MKKPRPADLLILLTWTLLSRPASPMCYQQGLSSYKQVNYQVTVYRYVSTSYNCGLWGWSTCYSSKLISEPTYQSNMVAVYYQQQICCAGYAGIYPNCNAQCTPQCANGGMCVEPDVCECTSGWTGGSCSQDVNECQTNVKNVSCDPMATCVNTLGSFYCLCPPGYQLAYDQLTCIDVNECASGLHNCVDDENCLNQPPGNFTCTCPEGYALDSDGHTCLDVNECLIGNGGCAQNCNNTVGSYQCYCNSGFYLDEVDLHSCTDHDECVQGTDDCEQICLNHVGHYSCSCEVGCDLLPDGTSCKDIDECSEGISGCNQLCTNLNCTSGGYQCSCHSGYILSPNNHTCIDIDECATNNGECQHLCHNNLGSYLCSCEEGYALEIDKHSCQALPCQELFDPLHGSISCSGPQVTYEVCNFSCWPGYYLTGSEIRMCQPNSTWTGTEASCPPLTCPELVPETDSVDVITPCYSEYNSTCTLACSSGYYLPGAVQSSSFQQACVLDENNTVHWTTPLTCEEVQVCTPSPCLHNSRCDVSDQLTPICTCNIYQYKGPYCETIIVDSPSIPPLQINTTSSPVLIQARPDTSMTICINHHPSIHVSPSEHLVISHPEENVPFTVEAQQEGVYKLNFIIATSDMVANAEDAIVVATSGSYNPSNTFFVKNGLAEGMLQEGCCQISTTANQYYCYANTNPLVFSSSCSWVEEDESTLSTNGISFIHNEGLKLPLSVVGLRASFQNDKITINALSESIHCQSCLLSNKTCHDYDTTPSDIADIVVHKSLLRSFLNSTSQMVPSGISLTPSLNSTVPGYKLWDYQAALGHASEVQSLYGCYGAQELPDALYYALRTNSPFAVSVYDEKYFYAPEGGEALCFLVNVCNGILSSLSVPVPKSAQGFLSSLPFISQYTNNGWSVKVHSISFGGKGIQSLEIWNGEKLLETGDLQYDTSATVFANGTLSGNGMRVDVTTNGVMYTSFSTLPSKAPSDLMGQVSMQFEAEVNGQMSTIFLTSNDGNVMQFPDEKYEIGEGSMPSRGVSINASLLPNSFTGYFGENLFSLLDLDNCPIMVFIACDDIMSLKWVTMRMDCVTLYRGKLLFPSLIHKVVIDDAKLTVLSIPNIPTIYLGNFIRMSSAESHLQLFISRSVGPVMGTLAFANVSFLDVELCTNITIGSSTLTFSSSASMFGHYEVSLSGSMSTSNSWESQALEIVGEMNNGSSSFLSEMNSYISSKIEVEVNYTLNRVSAAESMVQDAMVQLENLDKELNTAASAVENASLSYQQAQAQVMYWENATTSSMLTYNDTMDQYTIATDVLEGINSLCEIQECNTICLNGTKLAVCYKPSYMKVPDTCYRFVKKRIPSSKPIAVPAFDCEYVKVCGNRVPGLTWLKAGLGIAEFFLPGISFLAIPFSIFSKPKCKEICIRRYRTEIQYVTKPDIVEQLEAYPCFSLTYNGSTSYKCVKSFECATKIADPQCTKKNEKCEVTRNLARIQATGASASAQKELNAKYSLYQSALSSLTEAQEDADIAELNLDLSEQMFEQIELSYDSSLVSYNVSLASLKEVQDDMEEDLTFAQWVENQSSLVNIIQITSINFELSLTTQSPIVFPVHVVWAMSSTNSSHGIEVVVDFSEPIEIVKETISTQVIDAAFAISTGSDDSFQKRSSVRRQVDQQTTTNNSFSRIQNDCNKLSELIMYFMELEESLNEVLHETREAEMSINLALEDVDFLANSTVYSNTSSDFGEGKDSTESGLSYFTSTMSAYGEILNMVSFGEIELWHSRLDVFHNQTSSLAGYACFSFSDCLQTTSWIMTLLLQDIPMQFAAPFVAQVPTIKENVNALSYKNVTVDEASQILNSTLDYLNGLQSAGYLCAEAPNVTAQLPPQAFIPLGGQLELEFIATSDLPVSYRWTRNNVTLPQFVEPHLIVNNFQKEDAGEYVCEASNGVKSVKSIVSHISYIQTPGFNQTPINVVTYEGNEEGVEFSCDSYSIPTPVWSWMYQPFGGDAWTEVGNGTNVLTIDRPYSSDEGWYICHAENPFGNITSKPVSLTVLPVTITQITYPMEISFERTIAIDGSGFDEMEQSGSGAQSYDNFAKQVIVVLESYIQQTSATITNVEIINGEGSPGVWTIDFVLTGENMTSEDTIYETIEHIVGNVSNSLIDLESARAILDYFLTNESTVFPLNDSNYRLIPGSLVVHPRTYTCPLGQGLNNDYIFCVTCPPGQYWSGYTTKFRTLVPGTFEEERISECKACPLAFYQPEKGSLNCLQCPEYHSTASVATTEIEDCRALCLPHTYSSTGVEPCNTCDKGFYQPQYGASSCIPCQSEFDDEQCLLQYPPYTSSQPTSTTVTPVQTVTAGNNEDFIIVIAGAVAFIIGLIAVSTLTVYCCIRKSKAKRNAVIYNSKREGYKYLEELKLHLLDNTTSSVTPGDDATIDFM